MGQALAVSVRPRKLFACAVFCGLATAAIAFFPSLRFAYNNGALKIALETTATLGALVASFLLLGRVQRTRLLDELVLACGLTILAVSNSFFAILASVLAPESNRLVMWEPLIGSTSAALVIAASALVPRRELGWTPEHARRTVFTVSGAFVVLMLIVIVDPAGFLPEAVYAAAPTGTSQPMLVGHAVLLTVQLLIGLTYLVAALGFAERSRMTHDELSGWLAVASILAVAARANYIVYPSTHSMWLYSGDLFRLGFYVALLIGAAREISSYWASNVEAAQLEERRRIARDLHDGLAQEIAFIKRNATLLRDEGGQDPELVDRIIAAAERARLESRSVISALTSRFDASLDRALVEAAREAEERYGAAVDVMVPQLVILPPARREALLRIATEAIANAARHSGVDRVRVELEHVEGGTMLRIVDRGRGFDPAAGGRPGFGLVSMRERAEAIGGRFEVHSQPGLGTQIEVLV
jgi:signal transduction histidine kinase